MRDDAVSPKVDTSFDMNLRVNHLGAQSDPTQFEIDIWADKVLDSLRIEGTAKASARNLDATARLFMRGLHPTPLAGYLLPLGFKPMADSIGMEANATLKAGPEPAPSQALAATCSIDHVRFSADEVDFATLASIRINANDIDLRGAKISTVDIEGGRFEAARDTSGALRVAGFALVPVTASSSTASSSSSAKFGISLGQVDLHDMQYSFRDDAVAPPVLLNATISDFSIKPRAHGDATDISGAITLPGVAKSVRIDGVVQQSPTKQSAELALKVEGIHPDALRPYLASMGIESRLDDAQLVGAMHVDLVSNPQGNVTASAKISGVRLSDQSELLAMNQIDVAGARMDSATGAFMSIRLTWPARVFR